MPRSKGFDEKEVLKKAMHLFWEKGYHATSMQNLVDHIGINRASIYDTFGGKEQIFDQAFELYRKSNKQAILDFLSSRDNVKEGLKELFLQSVQEDLKQENVKGCFVVNTTTEFLPLQKVVLDQLSRNQDDFKEIFFTVLENGVARGQIDPNKDLRGLASFLFTLYNGLKVVIKSNKNRSELENMLKTGLSVLD